MKSYIMNFFKEYEYPQEAISYLLDAYDKVLQCAPVEALFTKYLASYREDGTKFYQNALDELKENSALCEVPAYTLHFLFCVCLTEELQELFQSHHIPENIYHDTLMDLKYKLIECHTVYGIWGTFVANWWTILFGLRLFTLGRLEFEVWTSGGEYHTQGGNDSVHISPGDTAIQVHIPSSGRLIHEECTASYKQAKQFFQSLFPDRKTNFICLSWLLFPDHEKFLPAASNILTFASDYTILSCEYTPSLEDLWRVFDHEIHTISDCTENRTSLQKAYIAWLEQGNKIGYGIGVFSL